MTAEVWDPRGFHTWLIFSWLAYYAQIALKDDWHILLKLPRKAQYVNIKLEKMNSKKI